jgi:hypothetical protein
MKRVSKTITEEFDDDGKLKTRTTEETEETGTYNEIYPYTGNYPAFVPGMHVKNIAGDPPGVL